MKFHETKMADINKSITELWNKTYKGSDIDGIQIKTEDEGQTADGRRKQTYRVVMRKVKAPPRVSALLSRRARRQHTRERRVGGLHER